MSNTKNRKALFCARLDQGVAEALSKYCADTGRVKTRVIEMAIYQYLKADGSVLVPQPSKKAPPSPRTSPKASELPPAVAVDPSPKDEPDYDEDGIPRLLREDEMTVWQREQATFTAGKQNISLEDAMRYHHYVYTPLVEEADDY